MANDELDALNALEKEAKEYDKVCLLVQFRGFKNPVVVTSPRRMPKLIVLSKLSDLMRKSAAQSDDI
jgi:hypothetical protein